MSSPPLAELPSAPPTAESQEHEPLRLPPKFAPGQAHDSAPVHDRAVQREQPAASMPLTALAFHGQGTTESDGCGSACLTPPDPNGAVGPNHFVQTVNGQGGTQGIAVWNKAGALVMGPKAVNSLFSALGATDPCRTHDDGDPVVVYDQLADRWFITQFALPNVGTNTGPAYQCIAVSKTADPTGAYSLYEFTYPYAIDDYGKFSVWPDAYYATFNQFGTSSYQGADFCAYDRAKMLAGAAATQQCFLQAYPTGTKPCGNPPYPTEPFAVFGALPASLDGAIPPPTGEPGYFLQFDYSQCGPNYDTLDLWSLHVDFTTPANSKLTGPTALTVADFQPTCWASTTGYPNCVPQPGSTVTLDALDDRMMFRFSYRNFGAYESLAVNHSVAGGSGTGGPAGHGSGVRWYEIQMGPGGSNPTIAQQSTWAPADTNWRFMGSIAQDQAGDMALGYAVSSTGGAGAVAFPSIGWTGRINTDAPSTMGQGEAIIETGTQDEGDAYTGPPDEHRGRWGDYSNMTIDPSDGCTFWYTQEVYDFAATPKVGNWDTYIASAKFPNCAQNDFTLGLTPTTQNAVDGGTVTYTVTTGVSAGAAETVALYVQDLPTGVTLGSFNPASVTAGSSSTLTLNIAANAPLTGSPSPTFMVIGKATSAVHDATAQIAIVACGAAGEPCCGGSTCTSPAVCNAGTCCTPTTACPAGDTCGIVSNGCGGTITCQPGCTGQNACVGNQCVCQPVNTCGQGQTCGTIPDGCGGTVTCAPGCASNQTCVNNACVDNVPDAGAGDAGGSDGGGSHDAGGADGSGPSDAGKGSDAGGKTDAAAPSDAGGSADAASGKDASASADTGAPGPGTDSGESDAATDAGPDGAPGSGDTGQSGGCGCRVAGATQVDAHPRLAGTAGLLLLGLVRLRRRRSSSAAATTPARPEGDRRDA